MPIATHVCTHVPSLLRWKGSLSSTHRIKGQSLGERGGSIALQECIADLLANVTDAGRRVRQEKRGGLVTGANVTEHVEVLSDEPARVKKST